MSGLLDQIGGFIGNYVDFLWLPAAWFLAPPKHRAMALAFVVVSLATLRTQVELMESTGYATGFLPLMDSHVLIRGMIVWGAVIGFFLVLAHFSPKTTRIIFMAASLSIYILAFCFSMLLMAL